MTALAVVASIRVMQTGDPRPSTDPEAVFEIRVGVYCTEAQARKLVDDIQLMLCPDPWHDGPCPIPWTTAHWDLDEAEAADRYSVLMEQVRVEQG
ncbi:hypothetical protein [Pseudonocardia sp. KRD291]|uniref:hypothetical protein n=1 Tax=Pseudonocardia sp. KRD291 TaxID=2792007 RepID=UPI001C49EC6F|nr:hypothetical protein [Pseudonocardia sp. KRD291]MBW0103664.1 hypothetical protein [Pseudonocardia sp. KRD291]